MIPIRIIRTIRGLYFIFYYRVSKKFGKSGKVWQKSLIERLSVCQTFFKVWQRFGRITPRSLRDEALRVAKVWQE